MPKPQNLKAFTLYLCLFVLSQSVLFFKLGSVILLVWSAAALVLFLLNFVCLGNRASDHCGLGLNFIFLVYTTGVLFKTGGFYSIAMAFFFLMPALFAILENRKTQLACLISSVAIVLFYYLIQRPDIGIMAPHDMVNISTYRLYHLGLVFICLTALLFNMSRGRTTADKIHALENKCHKVTQDAQNALKIKDEFLANMSHEIRNPMNGIIGMMHVLLDTNLNEEQKQYANIVYSSSRALLSIVNDILDLSKIEAGKLELDIRGFDLDLAIKDIVSLPMLQSRQKGLEFNHSIDPDVPCLLKGDIGRIRQVINNLCGNAVKFTESGEVSLTITLESESDTHAVLLFKIEDTGIGIKEEQISTLFESFTQADLSITKKYGGTGLGLAISKLLVEKMGGRVGVESIEMIGSVFSFTLDLEKQTESEACIDLSSKDNQDCKVLVLGDGGTLGKTFERNLDQLEINYEQAFDETEAYEMLGWAVDSQTPFDLVILEAKERDISCEKLAEKIRSNDLYADIRLMILSSVGKKGDARRFEQAGFSAFLSNPVERHILSDSIKAVLARPVPVDGQMLPIITRYTIIESKKHLRTILIVEDMETNLLTAKALIGKMGYQTDDARNGKEAVQKHKENEYDLILMDCQMPVLDGFEATRQIRENEKESNRHVPIVAMTGNAFESDKEKCFAAGMDDFMSKPVEPDILAGKIEANFLVDSTRQKNDNKDIPIETALVEKNEQTKIDQGEEHSDKTVPCFLKDKLYDRFGQDTQLISIILDSFFQEAPDLLSELQTAVGDNDTEMVRTRAHALKGSAANVNAESLRQRSFEMENSAKNNETDSFQIQLEAIQTEYDRFVEEVKK